MSAEALKAAIRTLAAGKSLSAAEATEAFDAIMHGDATPAQVAAVLVALRVKGETPDEVAGAARALRNAMVRVNAPAPADLVDTCGTGGGSVTTFNISTAAAFLAAGAGVRIAKHGNRSYTTKCGSADVLEALGISIDMPVERMAPTLERAGIVFMFAPLMHPAMRHVGPVRGELGIGTVMNIVGPLANPASAGRQVVGVSEESRLWLIAGALAALGSVRALVVHGEPGMDEISPLGCTHVVEVRDGVLRQWLIDPAELGFPPATAEELGGGAPAENARVIIDVLDGRRRDGARTAVVLNAAAAIYVSAMTATYAEAIAVASRALDNGMGRAALDRLRDASSTAE